MKALTFSQFGGPEVLKYSDVAFPILHDDEVMVKMEAIGLNYADIYRRQGHYHLKGSPPYIAGYEGAGTIIESNIEKYKVGDRVGFADVPFANAEMVAVPVEHLIPLSDDISFELAASVLLQGLTAQYLAEDSHFVRPGEIVLIHAAAGGVGQILTQICKLKGATVIGLTTRDSKKVTILGVGADYVLNLREDWKSQVLALTNGKGVDVVFDSIGTTINDSIDVTRMAGQVVFYGMSGGNPQNVDPKILMDGSKTLTGGDLWSYLVNGTERLRRSNQLFNWIRDGQIKVTPAKIFKLSQGESAHGFLEGGSASGKVIMIPD